MHITSISKLQYWFSKLSRFISIQLVAQGIGMISGIILVRTLSQEEYAYFTLANTMQGTMNTLADSGISTALSAIGGKVWHDPYQFGQLISSAKQVRHYLGAIVVTIVTPVTLWLLVKNGAGIAPALLLIIIILSELYLYLIAAVLVVVPRMKSQIYQLQNIGLVFAASRLALLGCTFLVFKLNASLAALISVFATGINVWLLRKLATKNIKTNAPINKNYTREIFRVVKHQAPNSIFYCFQGQITIFLISIFGSSQNIAEVGALSRLSVIFAVISSTMHTIVLPSFSRCQTSGLLWKRYYIVIGLYSLFSIALISVVSLFPDKILLVLGNKYSHLSNELVLMALGTVIQSFVGILWQVNTSKAWVKNSWIFIPLTVLTQIISLFFFDVSTTKGIILFGFVPVLPSIFLNFYMTRSGIQQLDKVNQVSAEPPTLK